MIDLTNKIAKEKAQLKSAELAKVKLSKFKKDNFDIEIVGDIKEIEVNGQHGIELFATAFKNGKQVGFGKDGSIEIERFRIFNPPVLVDDINGDIIREWGEEDPQDITKKITKQRKLKYDPTEAIKQSLAHTISTVAKDDRNIVKGKIGNTTSTFYPDADTESTSVDGGVRLLNQTSWATVRDAATGDFAFDTATEAQVAATIKDSDTSWDILRSYFLFDTSAIGDTDTIDSATFSLYGNGVAVNNGDTTNLILVSGNPASNTAITTSDYTITKFGSTSFGVITLASWNTGAYNDISLDASGLSNITATGISKFGILTGLDFSNIAPTGANDCQAYFADQTGTTNDPKLVVVHSAASTNTGAKNFLTMGVGK